jgi:hypothetical protein
MRTPPFSKSLLRSLQSCRSHTALSHSSSASSPALAFPTLPAKCGRFHGRPPKAHRAPQPPFLLGRIVPHEARKQSAGRCVDRGDQVELFASPLRPIGLAGVPLHKFAESAAPQPPRVYRLHLLFRTRHNLPRIIHCRTIFLLASRPRSFARYSDASVGPSPPYDRCRRDFHHLLFDVVDLAIRRPPAQCGDHRLVATLFHSVQHAIQGERRPSSSGASPA